MNEVDAEKLPQEEKSDSDDSSSESESEDDVTVTSLGREIVTCHDSLEFCQDFQPFCECTVVGCKICQR